VIDATDVPSVPVMQIGFAAPLVLAESYRRNRVFQSGVFQSRVFPSRDRQEAVFALLRDA
jgi:hypothetical protein